MPKAYTVKDRFGRSQIDPKYAALEREWYQKLADTGFRDIEPYDDPSNTYLHSHHIETRRAAERGVRTGRAEFFRLISEQLDHYQWRTRNLRWQMAAWVNGGFDFQEISDRFPGAGTRASIGKRLSRHADRILERFGLKMS